VPSFLTRHAVLFPWLTIAVVFGGGLWLGPGYSVNSLFVVAILLAMWVPDARLAYRLAAVATILLPVNSIVVGSAVPLPAMVFSRGMLAITFWLTAFVVTRYRESAAARVEAERALRRTEAALREQTALAQLGQMAAVVAHEVRNPLAGIRGAMQVMSRRLPPAGQEQTIIREVVGGIDSLNDIVQDLLLFARPRPPAVQDVPVERLLVETVSLLQDDPKLQEIDLRIDPTAACIAADPAQLKLVLRNLILNSVQAIDGRGEVYLATRSSAGWTDLLVIDSGPGIAPEHRAHAFEPFYTTKHRGTGLGLSTARRIIEAHGGTLTLEFPPGGGTTAVMRLRTVPPPEQAAPSSGGLTRDTIPVGA
jgi:signal transduction histidine kinase